MVPDKPAIPAAEVPPPRRCTTRVDTLHRSGERIGARGANIQTDAARAQPRRQAERDCAGDHDDEQAIGREAVAKN